LAAALVFIFTYVALSVGRVPGFRSDRLAASIIGAVAMVALGVVTLGEAQAAADAPTVGLLFGMMVLSAAVEVSGAFALAAWWVTRRARTPRTLLAGIAVASAVLSAFLINDVVCIALTPLVIHVAARVERDPKPYLLVLALSSNAGSVATITGNPQNILIGSLSHVSYGRFALALAPVAAFGVMTSVAVVAYVYRRELGGPLPRQTEKRPDVYARWVWKSSVVLLCVLVAFALGVPPVMAALLGTSAMLLTRAVDPKRLYVRVDWMLLALFVALFVVVAGVEKTGLADRVLHVLDPLRPDTVWGLTLVTAVLSNIVSNVPTVMVMKSSIPHLPHPDAAWLTLSMASTLAGNLTLPGSIATIIVVERAKDTTHISFWDFAKVGVATAVISVAFGTAWLALVMR
jgi:Na+/H+ antiporter NhaD/arsenite permease-like protein